MKDFGIVNDLPISMEVRVFFRITYRLDYSVLSSDKRSSDILVSVSPYTDIGYPFFVGTPLP